MSDKHESKLYLEFLEHVSKHRMKVVLDNGIHRHLTFRTPESGNMAFQIVTVPHYLMYFGDMGAFTFTRMEDMFQFFRGEPGVISPDYWSEKLDAIDRCDGLKKFNPEKFNELIKNWVNVYWEDASKDAKEDAIDCLQGHNYVDASHALGSASEYHTEEGGRRFGFQDIFECDVDDFTYRFLWCCHALRWGIAQYDSYKDPTFMIGDRVKVTLGDITLFGRIIERSQNEPDKVRVETDNGSFMSFDRDKVSKV